MRTRLIGPDAIVKEHIIEVQRFARGMRRIRRGLKDVARATHHDRLRLYRLPLKYLLNVLGPSMDELERTLREDPYYIKYEDEEDHD